MAVYTMAADTRSAAQKKKDAALNTKLKAESAKKIKKATAKAKWSNFINGDPFKDAASHAYVTPVKNTSSKKNKSSKIDNTYDTSDYANYYGGGYDGSGGYGGYAAPSLDISGLLAAYQAQADADKATAKQTYDTTRNDLLTSLKRFQEQNAKDVQNQQRSFLSNQAALESALSQADRQNRISSAARGLSGSGLQQLAQLQNLMSQGQDISDLATDNSQKMDTLRKALQEYQTDTDTKLNSALNIYNNALNSIEANLAKSKADAELMKAQYESSGGGYSGGGGSGGYYSNDEALTNAQNLSTALAGTVDAFQNSKKSKSAYSTARSQIYNILETYGAAHDSGAGAKALKNLSTIYKAKTSSKKKKKK